MAIPETILNQIKCCLNDDGHIVNEPILLSCGANACKKCVCDSASTMIHCFSCNINHVKIDLLNAPNNKIVDSFIHLFLNDLFKDLNAKLESIAGLLKGFFFFNKLMFWRIITIAIFF
jgi:hypothetical protein